MVLESSENGAKHGYTGRITSFVMLSSLVAAAGGILFGYDLGISGGVTSMKPFLKSFFPEVSAKMEEDSGSSNYCKFDSQLLTAFTSSLYIAGLFATFLASWVTGGFGRKASMLVGGVFFMAGAVLGGAAVNIYMLILGRLLLGVGIGFTNQSTPLYLSEMAPPKYRGAVNNGFEVCIGVGVFMANLINIETQKINSSWGWRISLALAVVPATILTLGTLFLSETPNSLLQRGCSRQKATELLQKIRGTTDVNDELDDIIAAGDASKNVQHPFHTIMQRKYRPQFVMAIAIPFFQVVTGIIVITFYAPIIFLTIGLGERSSLVSTMIMAVVGITFNVLTIIIVDRIGRRTLFMIGGALMLVTQVMVGVILVTQLKDYGGMGKGYAYAVLVLICVYVAGFGLSWGPLGWLVPSEIFPLEIRSVGQSIVVAVGFLFLFVVGQTLLAMLCRLKSGVFFFFGGWVLVMTVFVYMFLPETKHRPIERMDQVWREHWFWKKIVGDGEKEQKMDVSNVANANS